MQNNSARSVLVVGARGVLGAATAGAFEDAGWQVHRGHRGPGYLPGHVHLDLDDPHTVLDALARTSPDLVVTTVPYPGLTAEHMVLEQGGTLVSTALLTAVQQRTLAGAAAPALGRVVLNAGRVPGLTNLLAADMLIHHPDADGIVVAATFSAAGSSGPAGGASFHRMLTGRRRHRTLAVPFPAPIGPRRAIELAEDERAWLGAIADGRSARFCVAVTERPVHAVLLALNATRLISALPASAPAHDAELSAEPTALWVGAHRGSAVLDSRAVVATGGYRTTAVLTVLLAEAVLTSPDGGPGVRSIEEVVTLRDVDDALAGAGVIPVGT